MGQSSANQEPDDGADDPRATKTPPPPPASMGGENTSPGFGEATSAWLSAGADIADYEAGKAAEKRRLAIVVAVVTFALAAIVAAVVMN